MTLKSRHRAAEMALIDTTFRYLEGAVRFDQIVAAANELKALRLEALGDIHVGNTDTSRAAADSLGNIGPLALRVFDEIAYVDGLTSDQVEQIVGGTHQTISARVNELRDKGWIVDSGQRRKTRSGRPAIVWIPSSRARQEGARS